MGWSLNDLFPHVDFIPRFLFSSCTESCYTNLLSQPSLFQISILAVACNIKCDACAIAFTLYLVVRLIHLTEKIDWLLYVAIICSWADIHREHITKYFQLHKAITPGASILLIQSSTAALLKPYTWQRATVKPAAQYIIENALTDRQLASFPDGGQTRQAQGILKTKILLHSCSNDGSLTVTQLLILLRGMIHAPLPLIGIIMDSAPDAGTPTTQLSLLNHLPDREGRLFHCSLRQF
jgi:hypothetical protein